MEFENTQFIEAAAAASATTSIAKGNSKILKNVQLKMVFK